MFLGINYDKWHGIVAAVGEIIIFCLLYFLFSLAAHYSLITALAIGHWLQCWNESLQSRDPKLLEKYSSLEHFQKNSWNDFRWFWLGSAVAGVVNIFLFLIF